MSIALCRAYRNTHLINYISTQNATIAYRRIPGQKYISVKVSMYVILLN